MSIDEADEREQQDLATYEDSQDSDYNCLGSVENRKPTTTVSDKLETFVRPLATNIPGEVAAAFDEHRMPPDDPAKHIDSSLCPCGPVVSCAFDDRFILPPIKIWYHQRLTITPQQFLEIDLAMETRSLPSCFGHADLARISCVACLLRNACEGRYSPYGTIRVWDEFDEP